MEAGDCKASVHRLLQLPKLIRVRYLGDAVQVVKYHGQRRERNEHKIAEADIALTTYKTLATDLASGNSPLHKVGWFRIVLDEGESSCFPISSDDSEYLTLQHTIFDVALRAFTGRVANSMGGPGGA
jgi:hypothetical protein